MTSDPITLLVVDDDPAHRAMLRTLAGSWGYVIAEADDGSTAVEQVRGRAFDLVLMDVRMLRVSGLQALEQIKAFNPAIPVVIMTAYSSVETAVEALKKGAYDYLTKPLDFDKLRVTMERAVEHRRLKAENRDLRRRLNRRFDPGRIIGSSPAMKTLMEMAAQVAPTEATVLITGESGTGKEMIAGALHFNSHRREGPWVKLNCAAIIETLLESELFGHERGAFTGADRRREGRFVQASGGSIFLDEISEMPPPMQAKLLRVLQEREVTRVGGSALVPVDVRVIAATHRDLEQWVRQDRFRADLYYRLNVVRLEVPPLRRRRDDIPLLAQCFLEDLAEKNGKPVRGFTPRAMDALIRRRWDGNVRELMNTVERAVVLARGDYLDKADLQFRPDRVAEPPPPDSGASLAVDLPLEEIERRAILQALEQAGGNKSRAARRLGITRKTLHTKLKRYQRTD